MVKRDDYIYIYIYIYIDVQRQDSNAFFIKKINKTKQTCVELCDILNVTKDTYSVLQVKHPSDLNCYWKGHMNVMSYGKLLGLPYSNIRQMGS